ncbi:fumarylacetoacetate hydrolase family protein [Phenylobacterium montanum]|uniref:Fumarylacetoacetate hydrolase family protein n=1 Tax=Phenylobacterium montanum TaxID=2823693 RepID=A0A975IWW0_9CAUL|nr:fumarylacetoacetate hydrolase family protein [Caulobacter sp. S6]QUD90255.1 fumarylacetoacetate hydrolase family protein [Caulobacter sp. S6]
MRLASFKYGSTSSWGLVAETHALDVGTVLANRFADLRAMIAGRGYDDVAAAAPSARHIPLAEIAWRPPVPNPDKIICVGLNYEDHRRETGRPEAKHPAIFVRFSNSQIGHLTPITRPHVSENLDYEGELAVVIGEAGRYIPADRAMRHVAGYACYNDATVRDWQFHTHQFTPGKNFPGTGAFGPVLVTPDELGDLDELRLTTKVNGVIKQDARLGEMIFPIAELISYCSSFTQLEPGDVILTGTPGGVGAKRQPPSYLMPGDVVEIEISKVGVLTNPIVAEAEA